MEDQAKINRINTSQIVIMLRRITLAYVCPRFFNTEKGLKRGSEEIIDLEDETNQSSKKPRLSERRSINLWLEAPQLQWVYNYNWEK